MSVSRREFLGGSALALAAALYPASMLSAAAPVDVEPGVIPNNQLPMSKVEYGTFKYSMRFRLELLNHRNYLAKTKLLYTGSFVVRAPRGRNSTAPCEYHLDLLGDTQYVQECLETLADVTHDSHLVLRPLLAAHDISEIVLIRPMLSAYAHSTHSGDLTELHDLVLLSKASPIVYSKPIPPVPIWDPGTIAYSPDRVAFQQ